MAESHGHLVLGLDTGNPQSSEATAEPLDPEIAPADAGFAMEGVYLWPQ